MSWEIEAKGGWRLCEAVFVSTRGWKTHQGLWAGSRPFMGLVQAGWFCQRQVSRVSQGSLEAHEAPFQLPLWREGMLPSPLVPTIPKQDSWMVICRAAGIETLWNAAV